MVIFSSKNKQFSYLFMEMKALILLTIGQLFFALIKGNDVPGEHKRVVGNYFGILIEPNTILYPEDIDPSILTHLVYINGRINEETEEIYLMSSNLPNITSGMIERLEKLKEVNPTLKLILLITSRHMYTVHPSRRSNIIKNAVLWLNSTRFDGLQISDSLYSNNTDNFADFLCEMQSEFDKHGYTVSTLMTGTGPSTLNESFIGKLGRCSDFMNLGIGDPNIDTTILVSDMNWTKSSVDWYLERGLPANKMVITIPCFGVIVTLKDVNETGLGASISGPGGGNKEFSDGYTIIYNQLAKKLKNITEKWTIRREEESNAPYAYTNTGIWASYEDKDSVATKARYVLQKNLGGAHMFTLDMDEFDGIEGEERFPLTRVIHNTFKQETKIPSS